MPTEVYEDSIDLEIGLIEAENPRPNGGEEFTRAYPYPVLRPVSGRAVARTFPTVVVENTYLRATFVPSLGGRLLRLFDKVVGSEILPAPDRLMPVEGCPRGAVLRAGVQILTGPEERHAALAETPFMLDPPSEMEAVGVWFFGLGGDGSFHAHWAMPPDGSQLTVQVRTFNRSLKAVGYNGGLSLALGEGSVHAAGEGWFWTGGLGIWPVDSTLDGAEWKDGELKILRFSKSERYRLGRRQVDSWSASLVPIACDAIAATPEVSVSRADAGIVVRAATETEGKVLLKVSSGETLESELALSPGQSAAFELRELAAKVLEVAIQGSDRRVLLRTDMNPPKVMTPEWARELPKDALALAGSTAELDQTDLRDFSDEAVTRATIDPSLRPAAYVVQAMRRLAARDFIGAAERLEAALLFNAEDPLAWWLRAVALRKAGIESDERPELLNAHFLAPLEPALRAESFLSQPVQPGHGPAAILKPLADQPESFLEVACLLLDAGLVEDAVRWIEEALRHVDLALLRYLLAYAHLRWSGLQMEAAQHVALAAKLPEGPPYPWRRFEIEAIRKLLEAFHADERLKSLDALITAFC